MLAFVNPLRVGETRVLSFDCTDVLGNDAFDNGTPPSIAISNYPYGAKADGDPGHILSGGLQIDLTGKFLMQMVAVDLANVYVATITFKTATGGETIKRDVLLSVLTMVPSENARAQIVFPSFAPAAPMVQISQTAEPTARPGVVQPWYDVVNGALKLKFPSGNNAAVAFDQ